MQYEPYLCCEDVEVQQGKAVVRAIGKHQAKKLLRDRNRSSRSRRFGYRWARENLGAQLPRIK